MEIRETWHEMHLHEMHFVTRSAYACVRIHSMVNYMQRRGGTYDNMINRLQNTTSKVTTPNLYANHVRTWIWNGGIFQKTMDVWKRKKVCNGRSIFTNKAHMYMYFVYKDIFAHWYTHTHEVHVHVLDDMADKTKILLWFFVTVCANFFC